MTTYVAFNGESSYLSDPPVAGVIHPSLSKWRTAASMFSWAASLPPPPREPVPAFKKKHPEIPALARYDLDPGPALWDLVPINPIPTVPATPVKWQALLDIAMDSNFPRTDLLLQVVDDLRLAVSKPNGDVRPVLNLSGPPKAGVICINWTFPSIPFEKVTIDSIGHFI